MADDTRFADVAQGTYIRLSASADAPPQAVAPADYVAPDAVDGNIQAGAGLTGGGLASTNPTLNVAPGTQISIVNDTVDLDPAANIITDWDLAVTNGYYRGLSALHSPSAVYDGWWKGHVIAYGTNWVTQYCWPMAQNGIDPGAVMVRHRLNNVWDGWYRLGNYIYGWDGLDNYISFKANGDSRTTTAGITRFYCGTNTFGKTPSESDQFLINACDLTGAYRAVGLSMSTTGVVTFPHGHSMLRRAREVAEPVDAATAATVGIVAEMIVTALDNLGLLTTRIDPHALTGLLLNEPVPFTPREPTS